MASCSTLASDYSCQCSTGAAVVNRVQLSEFLWCAVSDGGDPKLPKFSTLSIVSQAAHCCKAHAKINTKIENSTPCKIVTHEDFNLKLGTRDYVGDTTHHATLGPNRPSGGFPPNSGNITPV